MKSFMVISLCVLLSCAFAGNEKTGIRSYGFPPLKLTKDILPQKIQWQEFKKILTDGNLRTGFVTAEVDDFVNKTLKNIQSLIIHQGLDPMELSDQKVNLFPTGSITLSDGWVEDLSTISTSADVIVKYTLATNVLEITLPLSFKTLLIKYKYHTQILLLGITGNVDAEISDVRFNLHIGFNFATDRAFVDKADVRNTGSIKFSFSGLGLLDWIIDAMSDVLTTLFHGIILGIIDAIIEKPVDNAVMSINTFIDNFLHPHAVNINMY